MKKTLLSRLKALFDIQKHGLRRCIAKKNVPGLIQLLNQSQRWDIRSQTAAALGELGDPAAVEPLIHSYKKARTLGDTDSHIKALGLLGDKRACQPLLESINALDRFTITTKALRIWRAILSGLVSPQSA